MERKRLGELIVEANLISKEQLVYALKEQKISKERLGQILLRLGYITEDILIKFLGKQHGASNINVYGEVMTRRLLI